jgi:hypothetical protein
VGGVVISHRAGVALLALGLVTAACQGPDGVSAGSSPPAIATEAPSTGPAPTEPGRTAPPPPAPPPSTEPPAAARERPAWLGTRVLPRRPDGFGEVRPTPRILRNRRLMTPGHLPDPPDDRFRAEISQVPDAVIARSTWSRGCPVGRDDLRYVTVTFWGFDERPHTGELLVHRSAARELAGVFRALYRERFPIEEMRVVRAEELDFPPTGDGNNTTAFVCRPSRGSTSWSQHAYGLAVDVNPFHNPYVRGDLVLPELASAYVDRDRGRPGMVLRDGPVTDAFAGIGWGWGGDWSSSKDWMHFSADGR